MGERPQIEAFATTDGLTDRGRTAAERAGAAPDLAGPGHQWQDGRRSGMRRAADVPALVGAAAGMAVSLMPSLLPREPVVQGVLSGLFMLGGAVLGLLTGRIWHAVGLPSTRVRRFGLLRFGLLGLAAFLVLAMGWGDMSWQNGMRAQMGMAPMTAGALPIILGTAVAVAAGLVAVAVLVRRFGRRTAQRFGPAVGWSAALGLLVAVAVVPLWLLIASTTAFGQSRDAGTTTGTTQPVSTLRSGSPSSLVAWQTLGRKGRDFVSHGPAVAEIEAFTGAPAAEPVRVYVGTASAPTLQQRAQLAVAELERSGAFDRSVLVLAMPTGTGMVEPFAADALEYLHGGDTAIVALQYSARPSWLSVVMDRQVARQTAGVLFEAVETAMAQRPAAERPALYLYGHSLGAEALVPVVARLPADNPAATVPAAAGTLILADASPVAGALLAGPPVAWGGAPARERVLVLRHASDPVAHFSPVIALQRPAWLGRGRTSDVAAAMRWIPLATMLAVAADLPQAVFVPWGYGHMYSEVEYGAAWAQLTGLGEPDEERLQDLLEQMRNDSSPVVGLLD